MAKQLYIILLCFSLFSCTAQTNPQNVDKKNNSTLTSTTPAAVTTVDTLQKVKETPVVFMSKPPIQKKGGHEFYNVNIGDLKKNDNTISYGSIVSAEPKGYKITKDYFPAINQNFRIKYIILHYTALNDEKSAWVLSERGVSAHYLVNSKDDREIYQLVDENKRSYHAGVSAWRNDKNLNDTSIGIEIVNDGYTLDSLKQRVFPFFPEHQVKKVAELVKDIAARYQIPPTNILAHSDIAPTRKSDPGPMFPWKKLYEEYTIGMWYDESVKNKYIQQIANSDFFTQVGTTQFIFKVHTALKSLGYEISPSGVWDTNTKKVLEAFQYHFRPEKYDGQLDAETWAILQALVQKYPSK